MKFDHGDVERHAVVSPPSRGAWIEIQLHKVIRQVPAVAPLAGGVD